MTVKQIAELVNNSTKEVLGEVAIQTEDLSNVVDIGKQIVVATIETAVVACTGADGCK